MPGFKKDVVIIGGGIAGVEAAIQHTKEGFEVELISERDYLFMYPMAIWIPFGRQKINQAAFPLSKLAKKHQFKVTIDTITHIDGKRKTITLEEGGVRYIDHLVIALGAAHMSYEGMEEHTYSVCGHPESAVRLQKRLTELIATKSGRIAIGFGGHREDPSAVQGGGPAFELLFNMNAYLTKRKIRDNCEITFFSFADQPGKRMGKKALMLIDQLFKLNDFQTQYGKRVERFDEQGILFRDGSRLESDLVVFIPARDGHPVIKASNLPITTSGFIRIDDFCQIEHLYGWYAIGDVAAIEGPEWRMKQGVLAEMMARNAARNGAITMGIRVGQLQGYEEKLNIVYLMDMGNGAAFIYRKGAFSLFIPLPKIGHLIKKMWGWYYKMSKLERIPRLPGM